MLAINIWQIDWDNDDARACAFLSLGRLESRGMKINPKFYKGVWSGKVEAANLEDIFYIFNMEHPADFRGHSLSVSDVVEVLGGGDVEPGFYFCDSWGWKRLETFGETEVEPYEKLTAETARDFMRCNDWLTEKVRENPGSVGMMVAKKRTVQFWWIRDKSEAGRYAKQAGQERNVYSITWIK